MSDSPHDTVPGEPEARVDRRIALFGGVLLVTCGACAAWLSRPEEWEDARLLITLAVLAIAIDRVVVQVGPMRFSGSTPILVLAMALLGPGPAVLIACVAAPLGPVYRGRRHWQVSDTGTYAAFALIGSVLFRWLDDSVGLERGGPEFPLAVMLTAVVVDLVNFGIVIAIKRGFQGVTVRLSVRETLLPLAPWTLVSAGLVGGTAHAYATLGFGALPVLGALLGGSGLLLVVIARAEERARQVRQLSAERDQLRSEASDAGDRERRRIGAELHDDAMQTLLSARQDVAAALEGDPRALATAQESLADATAKLRAVLGALHPPRPELDLAKALWELLERAGEHGLVWHLDLDPDVPRGDGSLIYLTVRELVSNVIRHAGASRLDVAVRRSSDALLIEVSDDGVGMDEQVREDAVRGGHIGLLVAEERVLSRGGSLAATSTGAGTRVHVRLPVSEPVPGAVA